MKLIAVIATVAILVTPAVILRRMSQQVHAEIMGK